MTVGKIEQLTDGKGPPKEYVTPLPELMRKLQGVDVLESDIKEAKRMMHAAIYHHAVQHESQLQQVMEKMAAWLSEREYGE